MTVNAGDIVGNQNAVNSFNQVVRNGAWNTIVYHSDEKHTPTTGVDDGQEAPDGEYSADNPSSGASVAGIGADGTLVTADTVFNHLRAATYNLTHIRQCKVRWRRQNDGNNNYTERGSADGITVRKTDLRQSVPATGRNGVEATYNLSASSFNNLCSELFDQWDALKDNRADFDINYCHNSCHTSCHTSRGRR